MATQKSFVVKNGLIVGTTSVVNSSGNWTGPQSTYQGVQGPTGSQGAAGVQGAQGAAGAQGATGTIGAQGAAGAQGAQGIGAQGVIGVQGAQGSQGATGTQGAAGVQGAQGAGGTVTAGAQGAQGVTGTTGSTGAAGVQGPQGARGPQGLSVAGAQGPTGFQGVQGASGPTGFQGRQGAQGAAGAQGPQGGTGPAGNQGPTGGTGPQGTAGSTPTGSNATIGSLNVGSATGAATGEIRASGNITAYYSDRRMKSDIEILQNCLEVVQSWTGIYYTQNKLAEKYGYRDYRRQVGLIAQQLKVSYPEVVAPAPFDTDENNQSKSGENYLTVQYEKIVPIIIQAIKEQQEKISELMSRLENRNK